MTCSSGHFSLLFAVFLAGVYIVVFFVAKCAKHLLAFRNTASVQISLFIWIGALYLNDQTVDSLRGPVPIHVRTQTDLLCVRWLKRSTHNDHGTRFSRAHCSFRSLEDLDAIYNK